MATSEKQKKWWKEHYDRNKDYYRERNKRRRNENVAFVNSLKTKPCKDCKKKYPPYVMDFDHLEGHIKIGHVAILIRQSGISRKRILEEISKCDLVCSNCHRIRTYERLGSRLTVGL